MSEKVQEFKTRFDKFKEALDYIKKNNDQLSQDPARYEKVKNNFINRFEKPLDEAWQALNKTEQKKFATLYFINRKGSDPDLKKAEDVADLFKGKITQVTLND